MIAIAVDQIG